MKKIISLLLFCQFFTLQAQVKILFDTDFGGDADDLGALAMLNNFHNAGECELLGIGIWTTDIWAVPAVDAVNTFYNNPDIPIGVRKDEPTWDCDFCHTDTIAQNFAYDLTYEKAPNAVNMYREILSKAKNKSIVFVTVGPLKNIQNLFQSLPDKHSKLNGKDLVHKKVKEFVIMGGNFPSGTNEWNFKGNTDGVTKFVIENIDLPITFSGFEVGIKISTGEVFNDIKEKHPLKVGFRYFSQYAPWKKSEFKGKIIDNATFDQTAVLYTIRGGVGEYWTKVDGGKCVPAKSGGDNTWEANPESKHSYLVLKYEPEAMATLMEGFMLNKFKD